MLDIGAISPELAALYKKIGIKKNGDDEKKGDFSQSSNEVDYLRGLASQTIQPYKPGWAALSGFGASIVGGLAARKLSRMDKEKTAAQSGLKQEYASLILGKAGGNGVDPGKVSDFYRRASSAGLSGLGDKVLAAYQPISEDTLLARRLTIAKIAKLGAEVRGSRSTRKIIKGADGYQYYQDDGSRVLPSLSRPADKKILAEQRAKKQATKNIGSMLRRLGQVADFGEGGQSPYTPHEVNSSIGNWQGDDNAWVMNKVSRLGGWIATLGSDHAPRDIRARINADALALTAAVKKVSRGSGEGVFTDADQKVLERQIGDLSKSSNVENYKQRLADLKVRINAAYGLSIGKTGALGRLPNSGRQTAPAKKFPYPDGTILEKDGVRYIVNGGQPVPMGG